MSTQDLTQDQRRVIHDLQSTLTVASRVLNQSGMSVLDILTAEVHPDTINAVVDGVSKLHNRMMQEDEHRADYWGEVDRAEIRSLDEPHDT